MFCTLVTSYQRTEKIDNICIFGLAYFIKHNGFYLYLCHSFLCLSNIPSCIYTTYSGLMAELFSDLRNFQMVLHNGWTSLHFHQYRIKVFSPTTSPTALIFWIVWFQIANVTGIKGNLTVVFICFPDGYRSWAF